MSGAIKFVVVELPIEKAVSKLISFLESNDFMNFVCTPHLSSHHSIQAIINHSPKMWGTTKFVVVELPVEKAISNLISFLESNNLMDFVCTPHLSSHHSIQSHIKEESGTLNCDQCRASAPRQCTGGERKEIIKEPIVQQILEGTPVSRRDTVQEPTRIIESNIGLSQPNPASGGIRVKMEPAVDARAMPIDTDAVIIKAEPHAGITQAQVQKPSKTLMNEDDCGLDDDISENSYAENNEQLGEPYHMITSDEEADDDEVEEMQRACDPPTIVLKRRSSNQLNEQQVLTKTSETSASVPRRSREIENSTDHATVKCMVCFKKVICTNISSGRSRLLEHAKTHCELKQYGCINEGCDYTNSYANVLHHWKSSKTCRGTNGKPKNLLNDKMKEEWKTSFERCYPKFDAENSNRRLSSSLNTSKQQYRRVSATKEKRTSSTRSRNSDVPTVQCMVCNKHLSKEMVQNGVPYANTSNMFGHAKTHSKLKQYCCPIGDCKHSSCQKQNMALHIRNVHGQDEEPKSIITAELLEQWKTSFASCFPGYTYDCRSTE